jgi:hypothetical protein
VTPFACVTLRTPDRTCAHRVVVVHELADRIGDGRPLWCATVARWTTAIRRTLKQSRCGSGYARSHLASPASAQSHLARSALGCLCPAVYVSPYSEYSEYSEYSALVRYHDGASRYYVDSTTHGLAGARKCSLWSTWSSAASALRLEPSTTALSAAHRTTAEGVNAARLTRRRVATAYLLTRRHMAVLSATASLFDHICRQALPLSPSQSDGRELGCTHARRAGGRAGGSGPAGTPS